MRTWQRWIVWLICVVLLLAAGMWLWLRSQKTSLAAGRNAYYAGDFAQAIERFEGVRVVAMSRDDLRMLADSYRQLNYYDKADAVNSRLLVEYGEDLSEKIRQANVAILAGEEDEAERLYQEVLDADSLQIDAYRGLGELYLTQGYPDKAFVLYDTGLGHDEIYLSLLYEAANSAFVHKNTEHALKYYRLIVAADPSNELAIERMKILEEE